MDTSRTRRTVLGGAAGYTASLAFPLRALAAAPNPSPLSGRFLTHISVVRVNQIEATPIRSIGQDEAADNRPERIRARREAFGRGCPDGDRKSTRLNSSHMSISYAVFCLKKKKKKNNDIQ